MFHMASSRLPLTVLLLASTLDRRTHRLPTEVPKAPEGIRKGDRTTRRAHINLLLWRGGEEDGEEVVDVPHGFLSLAFDGVL